MGSVVNLGIDPIHTGLRPSVVVGSVPVAVSHGKVSEFRDRHTTPLAAPRQSAATLAGKLEAENLFPPIFITDDVGAHLTMKPLVGAGYLLLCSNRISDRQKVVRRHWVPR